MLFCSCISRLYCCFYDKWTFCLGWKCLRIQYITPHDFLAALLSYHHICWSMTENYVLENWNPTFVFSRFFLCRHRQYRLLLYSTWRIKANIHDIRDNSTPAVRALRVLWSKTSSDTHSHRVTHPNKFGNCKEKTGFDPLSFWRQAEGCKSWQCT